MNPEQDQEEDDQQRQQHMSIDSVQDAFLSPASLPVAGYCFTSAIPMLTDSSSSEREIREQLEFAVNGREFQRVLDGIIDDVTPNENTPVDALTRLVRFLLVGSERGLFTCELSGFIMENCYDDDDMVAGLTENNHDNERFTEYNVELVTCVTDLIKAGRGEEVLRKLDEYKERAPRKDPVIFALMTCAMSSFHYADVAKRAYNLIPQICKTPVDLFYFTKLSQLVLNRKKQQQQQQQQHRNACWGRMRRAGIASYYTDPNKTSFHLLCLLVKYRRRFNWTHKQILNLCHPKLDSKIENFKAKNVVLTYVTRGIERAINKADGFIESDGIIESDVQEVLSYIKDLEEVKNLSRDKLPRLLEILEKYTRSWTPERNTRQFYDREFIDGGCAYKEETKMKLVFEHIPNKFHKERKVCELLLNNMPIRCLVRRLGKMTSLLKLHLPCGKENLQKICDKLRNKEIVKYSRIHPLTVFIALKAYMIGRNLPSHPKSPRRRCRWKPHGDIMDALTETFWISVNKDELRTDKHFHIVVAVSNYIISDVHNYVKLTPSDVAAVMSLLIRDVEGADKVTVSVPHDWGFRDVTHDFCQQQTIQGANMFFKQHSLCEDNFMPAKPIQQAITENKQVDVFLFFTDSIPTVGRTRPSEVLKRYREKVNPGAKLVTCVLNHHAFTIADPNDPNMLDICGFDTNVLKLISEFSKTWFLEKQNRFS